MKVSFDCLQAKLYSKFLITPKCIWKSKTHFGINWDILQVKIYDKLVLYEYSFLEEDISESNYNQYTNDEKYKKYFRMLKMGVPIAGVKQKIIQDNLDPSVLDNNNTIKNKPKTCMSMTNNLSMNQIRGSLLDSIKKSKLNPKTNLKTINNNNKNNTSDLIITQAMILGVKLNKTIKTGKVKEKSNKHLNPLISLEAILLKKSMLKSFD